MHKIIDTRWELLICNVRFSYSFDDICRRMEVDLLSAEPL